MADITESNLTRLLRNKREATQYQILVEIAQRQPAVSQREIADVIGITSQAVSNYLQELVDVGYVEKLGRGRYEVTKEGVDWLISRTDDLRSFVEHVSEEVIGRVDVESALATGEIEAGQTVTLSMADGYLHASPGTGDGATAVAIDDAASDQDVGVTDFEGVVDHEIGGVTAISIPTVRNGGSREVDPTLVEGEATEHDLLATAGVEAIATARRADLSPDIQFGTPEAVLEATMKGLDVLLLTSTDRLSEHTDRLREANVAYEVLDATAK